MNQTSLRSCAINLDIPDTRWSVPQYACAFTGDALEHRLVVVRTCRGIHVFGRHWGGTWLAGSWPEDLPQVDLAAADEDTRARIAAGLDRALSGLHRKAERADLRRVRRELKRFAGSRGCRWAGLLSFGISQGWSGPVPPEDALALLRWLRPAKTRQARQAAYMLEPIATRRALYVLETASGGERRATAARLVAKADAKPPPPLRGPALEWMGVTNGNLRWMNRYALDWPAASFDMLVDVVLKLPPERRPSTFASVRGPLEWLGWQKELLFRADADTVLQPEVLKAHALLFAASITVELDTRKAAAPGGRLPSPLARAVARRLLWRILRAVDGGERIAAHRVLCEASAQEREAILLRLGTLAFSLPEVQAEVESRLAEMRNGRGCVVTAQQWIRDRIPHHEGVQLSWPVSLAEIRAVGKAMVNCLRSGQGTEVWTELLVSRRLLVRLGRLRAVALLNIRRQDGDIAVDIADLRGPRNAEVSLVALKCVERLCSEIRALIVREHSFFDALPADAIDELLRANRYSPRWDRQLARVAFLPVSSP